MKSIAPVLTVLAFIIGLWWAAVAPMNIRASLDIAERGGAVVTPEGSVERRAVSVWRLMADNSPHVAAGYTLERPRLPTPTQVGQELWKTTGDMVQRGRAFSKRSLLYHGWITLQSTLWGFALGTTLGILGAIAIVYSPVARMSLMPWAIISQTIPIVALAPMIIVLSGQIGIDGRGLPKAIISAYLCYFPVLVSMVKACARRPCQNLICSRPTMRQARRAFGNCACLPACPTCLPGSRSGSQPRWSAPSWVNCRPGPSAAWVRVS